MILQELKKSEKYSSNKCVRVPGQHTDSHHTLKRSRHLLQHSCSVVVVIDLQTRSLDAPVLPRGLPCSNPLSDNKNLQVD